MSVADVVPATAAKDGRLCPVVCGNAQKIASGKRHGVVPPWSPVVCGFDELQAFRRRSPAARIRRLRLGGADGNAAHHPAFGPVVGKRVVLDCEIVPDCDRVRLPGEPDLYFRHLDRIEQHIEDRPAFALVHADDALRKGAVDEDPGPAGNRMPDHDRMDAGRRGAAQFGRLLLPAGAGQEIAALIGPKHVVLRFQLQQHALDSGMQGVVHRGLACEHGVAPGGRNGPAMQDRRLYRPFAEGDVRVPDIDGGRMLAVVLDQRDFRISLQMRKHLVSDGLAEGAGHGQMGLGRHRLVAEEHHMMAPERLLDFLVDFGGLRRRYIDILDHCANGRIDRAHMDMTVGIVRHRLFSPLLLRLRGRPHGGLAPLE